MTKETQQRLKQQQDADFDFIRSNATNHSNVPHSAADQNHMGSPSDAACPVYGCTILTPGGRLCRKHTNNTSK